LVVCSVLLSALALPAAEPAGASFQREFAAQLWLFSKINQTRKRHGLRQLRFSKSLWHSSRRYACRMLRRDYFGHMAHVSAPSKFSPRGEALAMNSGYRNRWRTTYRNWMRSSAHRNLILSRRFRWGAASSCKGRMGSSRARTWVLHVGRL
jgi:uncharacterized protein YkwD